MLPYISAAQMAGDAEWTHHSREILQEEISVPDRLKTPSVSENEVSGITKKSVTSNNREEGYINYTGFNLLPGAGPSPVRIQMVNGYQFNARWSGGVGVGYINYGDPLDVVPFFFDVKYRLKETSTAAFLYLQAGYSVSILADRDTDVQDHRGGFMLSPGIGLQVDTDNRLGLYLSAGFNLDRMRYEQEWWNGRTVVTQITYRRLMLGFGLIF